MLSYVRMGIDVSLEVTLCTKVKFIFSWNNNEFLRSASIDSSDRYKTVTWEEFEKVVRNKDFINENTYSLRIVEVLGSCT